MDLNLRIAGEAGQGVQTTGNLLVGACAKIGLHLLTTQSYMSRIRGGLNWFDIRISDQPLWAGREEADLLVALTPAALDVLRPAVAEGGVILFDGAEAEGAVALEFTTAAKEIAGSPVMANSVAAGAVFALLGYDIDALCEYLTSEFSKKGPEVIEKNVACVRRGAQIAAEQAGALKAPAPSGAFGQVVSGSEAVGLAAATSGVKFVSSYPMTPSTAVFTYLAGAADRYGIVVEQAEDEIAAVNMICGATYAGAPAMTTTSGGGFALMAEGLSLAGMMELPILILLSQRPGPATGLPTRTAQQDLKFALYAGHGEFPRAIFAPGTVRQAFDVTRRALETAHEHQSPVILMLDQLLADQQTTLEPLDEAYRPIDRKIVADAGAGYVRYALSDSGVSPRAIPGGEARVICDSDEHDEKGHIAEDLNIRVAQDDKRLAKLDGLKAAALAPEHYGAADAELVLLAWGSTYGAAREAVDRLIDKGEKAALLHFAQVWPIDVPGARRAVAGARRIISVEGNHTGQFASVLREAGAIDTCELILRYDGLPFTAEEIARKALS